MGYSEAIFDAVINGDMGACERATREALAQTRRPGRC